MTEGEVNRMSWWGSLEEKYFYKGAKNVYDADSEACVAPYGNVFQLIQDGLIEDLKEAVGRGPGSMVATVPWRIYVTVAELSPLDSDIESIEL